MDLPQVRLRVSFLACSSSAAIRKATPGRKSPLNAGTDASPVPSPRRRREFTPDTACEGSFWGSCPTTPVSSSTGAERTPVWRFRGASGETGGFLAFPFLNPRYTERRGNTKSAPPSAFRSGVSPPLSDTPIVPSVDESALSSPWAGAGRIYPGWWAPPAVRRRNLSPLDETGGPGTTLALLSLFFLYFVS